MRKYPVNPLPMIMIALFWAGRADAVPFFNYNNVAGFSTTSNPSGPWSYQSALIGALPSTATNMVYPDMVNLQSWATTFPTDVYCLIGPNGLMHPGNETDSLLGFIYPLSYSATVFVSVTSRDDEHNPSSDGKLLSLWLNDTQLRSQFLPGDYAGEFDMRDFVTMNPGDKLYLRLNRGSNNINFGDSQLESITVTQTSVPEPAALLLFGLGGISLFFVVRCPKRGNRVRPRSAAD
jgi:hypothetical protein